MRTRVASYLGRVLALSLGCLLAWPTSVFAQRLSGAASDQLEALVASAYQQASAEFPCKAGTRGKVDMLKWQEVDRCLNRAFNAIDWEALTRDLEAVRLTVRSLSASDFLSVVETSFARHALAFDQVFLVKNEKAHLPLTNSLLKFLPEESLEGLQVTDNTGTDVGKFAGVFSFERTGGLSTANSYKLTMFQYTTSSGVAVSPPEKLLLDSFGVRWKSAAKQKGFRLSSDRLRFRN